MTLGALSLSARRAWIEIEGKLDADLWVMVALRKESVDRNMKCLLTLMGSTGSLSARRAWIEIVVLKAPEKPCQVALRKESVDRNKAFSSFLIGGVKSLSARRAWIEIVTSISIAISSKSRSPQGERG